MTRDRVEGGERAGEAPVPPLQIAGRHGLAAPGAWLDVQILAAIGKIESNHGRSTLPGVSSGENFAGAGVISGSVLL